MRTGCSAPATRSIGARQPTAARRQRRRRLRRARSRRPSRRRRRGRGAAAWRQESERSAGMARSPTDGQAVMRGRTRGVKRARARIRGETAVLLRGAHVKCATFRRLRMNVLRFADLVAAGPLAGQRVFIRADLNVPQDDAGRITEDTRIRASLPCIEMALDAGAAVMVTSHLGRPTEGEFKPEDSLAPVAARLGELLGRDGAAGSELGRRRRRSRRARSCCSRTAASTRARRRTTRRWRRKMAALCDIFVHDAFGTAHRAEAIDLRHRRSSRRSPAPARCSRPRSTRSRKALAQPEAAAGRDRRRQQGLDQARDPAEPGEERRPADRRRRHRQHLHARRRAADRQEPGRAGAGRRGARRDRGDAGARRRGADAGRRRHRARSSRPTPRRR